MFKTLFGKTKPTAQKTMVFSGKPSKKKKNTYVIDTNVFSDMTLFQYCDTTPMPVIKINGMPTENAKGGWMHCTEFPNPGANQMANWAKLPEWCEFMGTLHGTIVEYLDKQTNKPLILLFPNNMLMFFNEHLNSEKTSHEEIISRLNHASRRDLQYQIEQRKQLFAAFQPIYQRRTAAMQNAPTPGTPEYYRYIRALDESQVALVRNIKSR